MTRPIIIIGAGRSGTNLLRDLLCLHPLLGTWPCDEVNPMWRYGNPRHPHDELQPCHATPRVRKYIRRRFEKLLRAKPGSRAVEKTCANCLRVEYVYEILPEACFVHIVRDGRDVAASACRRWCGQAGFSYILRKARFTPWRHLPLYGAEFALNRLGRLANSEGRLRSWGPRFAGMEEAMICKTLLQVCGLQWVKCVEAARRGLAAIPPENVFELGYEKMVLDPEARFEELFEFLEMELTGHIRQELRRKVTAANIGKWKQDLSHSQQESLSMEIGSALQAEGYL